MKIILLIFVSYLILNSCHRQPEARSLEDINKKILAKIGNTVEYQFPELEMVLRNSLNLRTFKLPVSHVNNDMMLIADIEGELFYGQNLQSNSPYFTICRSARGSELLCCSHNKDKGFTSTISYEKHVHWSFKDPQPKIEGEKFILATSTLEGGKQAVLYIGSRQN